MVEMKFKADMPGEEFVSAIRYFYGKKHRRATGVGYSRVSGVSVRTIQESRLRLNLQSD